MGAYSLFMDCKYHNKVGEQIHKAIEEATFWLNFLEHDVIAWPKFRETDNLNIKNKLVFSDSNDDMVLAKVTVSLSNIHTNDDGKGNNLKNYDINRGRKKTVITVAVISNQRKPKSQGGNIAFQ